MRCGTHLPTLPPQYLWSIGRNRGTTSWLAVPEPTADEVMVRDELRRRSAESGCRSWYDTDT